MSATMETAREGAVFEELRPLLFSIAYRMLGSVAEAEDVVRTPSSVPSRQEAR
jgi:RNA polymerase sigma-70 factor (ECF subfamily)